MRAPESSRCSRVTANTGQMSLARRLLRFSVGLVAFVVFRRTRSAHCPRCDAQEVPMLPKMILVAHDFSDPANRALAFAADLAEQVGASLEVMHVHPDVYDGHSDPALGLPWPAPEQVDRYMRFLDTELERAVRGVLGEQRDSPVKR